MTLIDASLLVLAAFAAGLVNAIAGGGTFLTFGALTAVGVSPIVANATSSMTQFPGQITSTLAYWRDVRTFGRSALVLGAISVLGALAGAYALLALDNPLFRALVPWLLLAATALFAAGPWLRPKLGADAKGHGLIGLPAQFLTAIYGGFFGAGMGVMMLATLGLTIPGDYHRLNAMKNLLAGVIGAVSILVFVAGGVIAWPQALVMIPAVAGGAYAGVWLAKRAAQHIVRAFVIAIGLGLAAYYFVTG